MDKGYAAWAARWRVPLGFAFGVAYLVFSQPTPRLLLVGASVAFAGVLVRGYAAGSLDKNQNLAVSGPYARTRNPLYLGSLMVGAGFAVAGGSWILGLALLGLFVLIYWPVMRREEEFLRARFGETYECYARAVPFFFPALRAKTPDGEPFRWERYRQNREYQAALGFVAVVALLAIKMMLR